MISIPSLACSLAGKSCILFFGFFVSGLAFLLDFLPAGQPKIKETRRVRNQEETILDDKPKKENPGERKLERKKERILFFVLEPSNPHPRSTCVVRKFSHMRVDSSFHQRRAKKKTNRKLRRNDNANETQKP